MNAIMVAVSVLQCALSGRVQHTTGVSVGTFIGSMFVAKYLGMYANHLKAIPPVAVGLLGAWVMALLIIRLCTLKPTKGDIRSIHPPLIHRQK